MDRVVLVTDHTWPSVAPEAEVLRRVGARLVVAETGEESELVSLVPEADAILTCFARVSAPVVRAGERLQVIGRYGIGVDNIAVEEATKLGIPVTNVPAYCLDEVAEHALALLLGLARGLRIYDRAIRDGDWELSRGAPLHRVAGRTLAIVGFGKIGQALAGKAAGLGLRVLTIDRTVRRAAIEALGAEPAGLDEALAQADFVSLHCPLTDETRGLMDESRLRRMKPTAFLINTARGGLVDHDALLRALREGWIAGAGLDVFDSEPLEDGHPLLRQPNLIATPHVAFYSEESLVELETRAAENVAAILDGRVPASVVNPEVLELERWEHLRS
jgi:D-3-phosphoglycerate dehydrogenase / 2-oxoglutarate reductase